MSLVSFGVAINPTMFLGIRGAFEINSKKDEAITPNIQNSSLLHTAITKDEKSEFVVTTAFGLNKTMGFHYTIARGEALREANNLIQSIIGTDYESMTNQKNIRISMAT